jgi:hypothetical protein
MRADKPMLIGGIVLASVCGAAAAAGAGVAFGAGWACNNSGFPSDCWQEPSVQIGVATTLASVVVLTPSPPLSW